MLIYIMFCVEMELIPLWMDFKLILFKILMFFLKKKNDKRSRIIIVVLFFFYRMIIVHRYTPVFMHVNYFTFKIFYL
jgi:hypothetical protein